MRSDWDERAKENAFHYVESSRETWTPEEFYESGRDSVKALILDDAGRVYGGRDPKQMTVLEIGCGAGRMTRSLAEVFGQVYAVDVSGEMIARAREGLAELDNVHLFQNNGTDLSVLPEVELDFAFSFIVFQHIPDIAVIERYVADVAERLKPGAVFKFQVQGYWRSRREKHDSWLGCTFTARDALRIADANDLVLEDHEGVGTEYFWLWMAKRERQTEYVEPPEVTEILRREVDSLEDQLGHAREWAGKLYQQLKRDREILSGQIKLLSEQRTHEITVLQREIELRQSLGETLMDQCEKLEGELDKSNEWARGLDREIETLRADRDRLLKLYNDAEREKKKYAVELEDRDDELESAQDWAHSLDEHVAVIHKHLQQIYGSLSYRIGRRLGLAPAPVKAPGRPERG